MTLWTEVKPTSRIAELGGSGVWAAVWVFILASHILPPSEIDSGLCLAVLAGSGGKYLFHRIG